MTDTHTQSHDCASYHVINSNSFFISAICPSSVVFCMLCNLEYMYTEIVSSILPIVRVAIIDDFDTFASQSKHCL